MNTIKQQNKKLAILLATYNGEEFLWEQIDSIMSQSFSDFKIYIHDDGSTDRTVEVIDEIISKYPDSVCKVEGPSTGGAKSNFFYLMKQVEADYYMCSDQDDFWKKDKIKITFEKMLQIEEEALEDKASKSALVFTDLEVVDNSLNTIAPSMSQYQKLNGYRLGINRLVAQNVVTGCTMMMNKALRDLMIKEAHMDKIIMHDWWASLIAAEFGKIAYVDVPTIKYRQHGDNSVGAKNVSSAEYQLERVKQKASMKNSLLLTREQALEFARVFDLPEKHLVCQYGNIMTKSKLYRWYFYLSKKVLKTGLARVIGQLILG